MTTFHPGTPGPVPGEHQHVSDDLLARYAAGLAGPAAWPAQAHLTGCEHCRTALSAHVDPERLARNRSVLLVRVALPDDGPVRALLRRCGVPDHLFRLLSATPSLRRSWLLATLAVLVTVTAQALLAGPGWAGAPRAPAGAVTQATALVPFLLAAPMLALASVAAAFSRRLDPSHLLAVAAPFSEFTLLLVRAVSALVAALVPAVLAAFVVPGPGWLPAALLLPSLALSAFALAAATVLPPLAAAVVSGALWVSPVLALALIRAPFAVVHWHAQAAWALVTLFCAVALFVRRDRLELGGTR